MSRCYVVSRNERDQEVAFLARGDNSAIKGGTLQLNDRAIFDKFRLARDFYLEAAVDEEPTLA